MKHHMKLKSEPFNQILSGQKTFELRLYDKKRQQIKVDDEIEFSCFENNEKHLIARVLGIYVFNNFAELYNNLPLLKCGYTLETIKAATPNDMNQYYSIEEQSQYGVVGIEIELINTI